MWGSVWVSGNNNYDTDIGNSHFIIPAGNWGEITFWLEGDGNFDDSFVINVTGNLNAVEFTFFGATNLSDIHNDWVAFEFDTIAVGIITITATAKANPNIFQIITMEVVP